MALYRCRQGVKLPLKLKSFTLIIDIFIKTRIGFSSDSVQELSAANHQEFFMKYPEL